MPWPGSSTPATSIPAASDSAFKTSHIGAPTGLECGSPVRFGRDQVVGQGEHLRRLAHRETASFDVDQRRRTGEVVEEVTVDMKESPTLPEILDDVGTSRSCRRASDCYC